VVGSSCGSPYHNEYGFPLRGEHPCAGLHAPVYHVEHRGDCKRQSNWVAVNQAHRCRVPSGSNDAKFSRIGAQSFKTAHRLRSTMPTTTEFPASSGRGELADRACNATCTGRPPCNPEPIAQIPALTGSATERATPGIPKAESEVRWTRDDRIDARWECLLTQRRAWWVSGCRPT